MGLFDKVADRRDDDATRRARECVARGDDLRNAGQTREALAEYLRAVEFDPNCADAQFGLGGCYHQLAREENGLAGGTIYFRAGLENLTLAVAAFEVAANLQPDSADTQLKLGLAHDNASRLEEAERCYRRAIELDPDGMDGADAHFNLALLLYMRARGWAGLKEFPPYAATRAGDPLAQEAFAEAETAAAVGEKAYLRNPDYLSNLIMVHRRTAKWYRDYLQGAKALEHYRAILRLDPSDAEAKEAVAEAERPGPPAPAAPTSLRHTSRKLRFDCPQCGKPLNAPVDMAGASAVCPNCGAAVTVPASPPETRDDPIPAGGDFLARLSTDEKRAVSNLNPLIYQVVLEYKKTGTIPAIVGFAARTVELLKGLPVGDLERLARCGQLGAAAERAADTDPVAALRLYREAAGFNPYDATVLMSYGCLLGMQGDLRQGIAWVERALEVDPGHEQARKNLRAMRDALGGP